MPTPSLSERLALIYAELGELSSEAEAEWCGGGAPTGDTCDAIAAARRAVLHACNRAHFDEGAARRVGVAA